MPKTARRKPDPSDEDPQALPPVEQESGDPGNGTSHEEPEEMAPADPPAQMEVKMRGSASAVRAAARKMSEQPQTRESRKEESPEPPFDENAALLSDPKNMVIVTRQLPRVWTLRSGGVRCAIKVEKYGCPMRREEIEQDVFDRFGGKKYTVTIHPNTTTGEGTILGAFTIEHPNPEEPPYIEDPEGDAQAAAEAAARIPGGTDPTMRETDNLADVSVRLQRRLERAQKMKEIKETERLVKQVERELEDDGKPSAPAAPPTGPDPRDVEIVRLKEQLAEKKVDDRFAAMQGSIAELTKTVQALATRPAAEPKPGNDNALLLKVVEMSNTHSKEMLDVVKLINKPVVPVVSTEDNFDKMLDRLAKMKAAMGGDDSRVAKFQDQLLEIAMERALGGAEDGEEEDTIKFAIKQMTPVLKTYVEKQVEKEEGGKSGDKQPVSKERLKEIYAEAGAKAAKEIAEKWQREGLVVKAGPDGKPAGLPAPGKKGAVPPRNPPPGKVVGRQKTAEGIVEHIQVVPTDLSEKPKKKTEEAQAQVQVSPSKKEEVEEVRYTDMPGIGRVEIPDRPGEIKYDRKKSVNYVLDSILSEIAEGTPQKAGTDEKVDSFVPADALEYLDDELLAEIHKATSGDELEGTLGAWGERAKLDAIKKAGEDKAVDSWVRRVIRTIQDYWRDQKNG